MMDLRARAVEVAALTGAVFGSSCSPELTEAQAQVRDGAYAQALAVSRTVTAMHREFGFRGGPEGTVFWGSLDDFDNPTVYAQRLGSLEELHLQLGKQIKALREAHTGYKREVLDVLADGAASR